MMTVYMNILSSLHLNCMSLSKRKIAGWKKEMYRKKESINSITEELEIP